MHWWVRAKTVLLKYYLNIVRGKRPFYEYIEKENIVPH